MANIQIIDRKTAFRSGRETEVGDVHVQITDLDSKSPRRAWWIAQTALDAALETMTLGELDRLVLDSPGVRDVSRVDYPLRDYYLPLIRENRERHDRGERGEDDNLLWRWRSFSPTTRSSISAICRFESGHWINRHGDRVL